MSTFNELIDFTRSTTGTYLGSDGLLKTAAINEPRLEYDASGNPLGLLIEEARTNLISLSNFNNVSKQNVTTVNDYTVAPDGTNTAVAMFETTSNSFHRAYNSASYLNGNTYTQSVFLKSIGGRAGQLTLTDSGFGTIHANFDLVNGVVGTKNNCESQITPAGNGWYRCSITATAVNNSGGDASVVSVTSPTSIRLGNFAGDTSKGLLVYGLQVETGAFPTSYIPTTGSTVTRAIDSAVATLSDFYYRQKNGSMVVEFTSKYDESAALFNKVYEIGNTGTNVNRIMTYVKTDETRLSSAVWDNNVFQSGTNLTTSVPNGTGVYSKAAYAWETNNARAALDGNLVGGVDTSVSLTQTRDTLGIMRSANSTGDTLTGHIKSIQYYPLRVADAKLETLTS